MSDFAAPDVTGEAVRLTSQELTPETIETILGHFRRWLQQLPATPPVAPPVVPPPDLHTLLGQLIALRQEVNLQTRAVRAQQEQNVATLHELAQAVDHLADSRSAAQQEAEGTSDELLRPLLKTLIDLYDSLALASREVRKGQDTLTAALEQVLASALECVGKLPTATVNVAKPPPEESLPRLPWLARLCGAEKIVNDFLQRRRQAVSAWLQQNLAQMHALQQQLSDEVRCTEAEAAREELTAALKQATARVAQLLQSIITGYTMSLQRIDRALEQHGLEVIPCLGRPFDPETMEVVEVVSEPGRTASEVIEEVRRGYLWKGRVFRFAQVRVARPV